MEKKLVRIGNSFGLVIDRALCRIVGIGPNTPLRVSASDGRLVIQALALPLAPLSDTDLLGDRFFALMRELMDRHGMDQREFEQLHHAPTRMAPYALRAIHVTELEPDELASRKRLKACLIARRAKMPWSEAVACALKDSPRRSEVARAQPNQ